jgi:hypothetical protein
LRLNFLFFLNHKARKVFRKVRKKAAAQRPLCSIFFAPRRHFGRRTPYIWR